MADDPVVHRRHHCVDLGFDLMAGRVVLQSHDPGEHHEGRLFTVLPLFKHDLDFHELVQPFHPVEVDGIGLHRLVEDMLRAVVAADAVVLLDAAVPSQVRVRQEDDIVIGMLRHDGLGPTRASHRRRAGGLNPSPELAAVLLPTFHPIVVDRAGGVW